MQSSEPAGPPGRYALSAWAAGNCNRLTAPRSSCAVTCVALRVVEVPVAEQLLHLAQVRAGAQQLGGQDVAQHVPG
jgi:hypothetical protein